MIKFKQMSKTNKRTIKLTLKSKKTIKLSRPITTTISSQI